MPKKTQTTICTDCQHCIHYLNPDVEDKNEKFNIVGYDYGSELFVEPGVLCGVAGIRIQMNILQCEKFETKENGNRQEQN